MRTNLLLLLLIAASTFVAAASPDGHKVADAVGQLPGQPTGDSSVNQYAGYITVDDEGTGRALFYYFAEARGANASNLPLMLWLNGGPGCSSIGAGAFLEHGPFLASEGGKTLRSNPYAWTNVAHVIYLDAPAGTGFSYESSPGEGAGDERVAGDNLKFLEGWLERFPEYKARDLYLAGEGYAGNYLPQLAQLILNRNSTAGGQNPGGVIRLKKIILGNPAMDVETDSMGVYEYLWSHGMITSAMRNKIRSACPGGAWNSTECLAAKGHTDAALAPLYAKDLTASVCARQPPRGHFDGDVDALYECPEKDVKEYLSLPEVRQALHVNTARVPEQWLQCNKKLGDKYYKQRTPSTIPIIKSLLDSGVEMLIYSGDADSVFPMTGTRTALTKLDVIVASRWSEWIFSPIEMGGYTESYKGGVTYATVKGAGHMVPKTHPQKMIKLLQLFLGGTLNS